MADDKKGIYNNKHGYTEVIELIELIHTDKIDSFLRAHRNSEDKCPPLKLMKGRDVQCMWCMDCWRYCIGQIVEKKDHYLVKKVKYMKSDLDSIKESD